MEERFEWEERDSSTPFWQHAVAGSCAGVMEHLAMYPIDTVKTHIQASSTNLGAREAIRMILQERGVPGLVRGATVIGTGCIPAHVGLFSTYEFAKARLLDENSEYDQPLRAAACGAAGTLVHDSVLTPADVVKQRLQLGRYAGPSDCIRSVWRVEGLSGFYRSLPTTLAMNIPYWGLMVAANESLKRRIFVGDGAGDSLADAPLYFLSAGISGGFAAALTTPMDVVKTRLQTRDVTGALQPRQLELPGQIFREEGARGFLRGLGPRVALAAPAAGVCWGTYETARIALHNMSGDGDRSQASRRRAPSSSGVQCSSTSAFADPQTAAAETYEWEEWDCRTPFWKHAVAGSSAGVMEHVAMYPADTIKTRMQALPVEPGKPLPGVLSTFSLVVREQGALGHMRGCFAIGVGCVPAHIGLFGTLEFAKSRVMDRGEHQPLRAAFCGATATVVHDAIITPTDVVKQRLQLGRYSGALDCVKSMWRQEGLRGFYRSLPTTLISECPFHGVLVASNESLKVLFKLDERTGSTSASSACCYFASAGVSGILATLVTQPLDVVKTRLQTQIVDTSSHGDVVVRYKGLRSAVRIIYADEGPRGFFRGTLPRMFFAAPSAAMCWGTYEVIKSFL